MAARLVVVQDPEMKPTPAESTAHSPLESLEEWEDFVRDRYAESVSDGGKPFQSTDPNKKKEQFRNYEADARPTVREFYRQNHKHQTYEFAKAKRKEFLARGRRKMGIWEAAEYLNTLVDDSDPDTDLSQLQHLLQTAEDIRRDGHPRWFIMAGFIHDLGKILCLWGEPQWAVVGDTFPTGCRYSEKIVFPQFFADNPDSREPRYQTPLGIYEEGCGLDQVQLAWGHDEYIYHVAKDYLPEPALYMLRYHSFYPWHREGEYAYLTTAHDCDMLEWVQAFNPYDLYTKSHEKPDVENLRPFYEDLIAEFFPAKVNW
jgi:inositol oxygenase